MCIRDRSKGSLRTVNRAWSMITARSLPAIVDSKPESSAAARPATELNFRQAETALELCLAELQSSDLDVEAMAELYRRASGYADRCDALLQKVGQEVMQWDPDRPQAPPQPLEP